ncbi:MAG: FMN-binding glutamate synthase family protein [Planctomycetota bacterium]|nr:FMN-binding glutamate synthase family protein [Planctomycetota bacterium]MDA1164285.1 FMN-binding glutamate synthase family protein [Planctomycetota bacterium]
MHWLWYGLLLFIVLVIVYDVVQKKHAILRNFPIIGHFRYLLEMIGPELRQYIVTSNNEERPFSRDERTWVYASAKKQNNYFGFGTDNDLEHSPGNLIIKHAAFPLMELRQGHPDFDPTFRIPCPKILGEARNRTKAFRPASVVNISGMSFGSLSGPAIEAFNRGASIAGCLHNTGEGGISDYHHHGGDLIWQIGTGYFGCRDEQGRFSLSRFKECIDQHPIRAIEVKLSQGAKPGLGGLLPAAKITPEIANIRGIPMGKDCASPSSHSAFHDADSMLDFVEMIAAESGLPVGIKSAVGESQFWSDLARLMDTTGRGVDFITVDGGEGGTGAAPLVFSDHVALPFKLGFNRVYHEFFERGNHSQIVFIGSGKLGFPATALLAFALGCDMVNVAREPMLAIGCIQAQRCHTGHCPTGVATQNRWLMRGLDPTHKGARVANYIVTLRKEILQLSRACGVRHPSLVTPDQCEITDDCFGSRTAREVFKLSPSPDYGLPSDAQRVTMLDLPATTTE